MSTTIIEGVYEIILFPFHLYDGYTHALDVEHNNKNEGGNIIAYSRNYHDNQKWEIIRAKENIEYYQIVSQSCQMAIGVNNENKIQTQKLNSTSNSQFWKIENKNNMYMFFNVEKRLYLTVDMDTHNLQLEHLRESDDDNPQLFVLSNAHIRFLVTADLHIYTKLFHFGSSNQPIDDNTSRFKSMVNNIEKLNPKPQFISICGDLTNGTESREEGILKDLIAEIEQTCPVREGWGNHDMYEHSFSADIGALVKERNKVREKNQDCILSDNEEHYYWKHKLGNTTLHFFMLNLVPGYGSTNDRNNNPAKSLDFLKNQIGIICKKEPIFLFFHTHYGATKKWWPEKWKNDFVKVVQGYNLICSFFGHDHEGNYTKPKFEYVGSPKEGTEINGLRGFLCAGGLGENPEYLQVDISLINQNTELGVNTAINTSSGTFKNIIISL